MGREQVDAETTLSPCERTDTDMPVQPFVLTPSRQKVKLTL